MKNIGIIGLGHQSEDYIQGIRESLRARLVAVCDVNEQLSSKVAERLGVRGYTNYHTLLKEERLDFVVVVTPHDVHRDVIAEAAARGVNVLKEKPLARNLREALDIKALCQTHGIQLMTAVQRRFNPMYVQGLDMLSDIGRVNFVEVKYTMYLDNPLAGWRGDKQRSGGGTLIDMGYHMVDVLVWYMGLPTKILAEFQASDAPEITTTVQFAYDSGVHGVMMLSRKCPPKSEYIRVLGSNGILEVGKNYIKRMKPNGDLAESLQREHLSPSATLKQVDYFCAVLDHAKENIGSPDTHLDHVRFIDACYRSQDAGQYLNPNLLEDAYV